MTSQKKPSPPIIVLNRVIAPAGQALTGKVLLCQHSRFLKAASIIRVYGEELVNTYPIPFTKQFFMEELKVWDEESGTGIILPDSCHTRPAAHHCFSFSFPLPDDLPPTFHTKKGSIRYYVEVIMDWYRQPLQSGKQEVFLVQKSTIIRNPREGPSSKMTLGQKDMTLKTTISDRVIFPGQPLQICAQLKNESTHVVRKIKFKLIRMAEYHTPGPNAFEDSKETTIVDSGILDFKVRRMEQSDYSYTMPIPMQLYPSFAANYIRVSYKLQVKLLTDKYILHNMVVFTMPITASDGDAVFVDPLKQLDELTNFGFKDRVSAV